MARMIENRLDDLEKLIYPGPEAGDPLNQLPAWERGTRDSGGIKRTARDVETLINRQLLCERRLAMLDGKNMCDFEFKDGTYVPKNPEPPPYVNLATAPATQGFPASVSAPERQDGCAPEDLEGRRTPAQVKRDQREHMRGIRDHWRERTAMMFGEFLEMPSPERWDEVERRAKLYQRAQIDVGKTGER